MSGRGHPVARPVLFFLWTLVFWGTLVAGAVAWRSVEMGLAAAVRTLLAGTSAVSPVWGWISLASAVFAVAVWTAVGILLARRHLTVAERE